MEYYRVDYYKNFDIGPLIMNKLKPYRPLIIIIIGLLSMYCCYLYFNHYRILNAPYGVNANLIRTKLKIPLIEENMRPGDSYDKSGNRWFVRNEFPDYGHIIHIYKFVKTDSSTLKIEQESDAFMRKVNDTVFRELIIAFQFKSDTINSRRGVIVDRRNSNSYNFDPHTVYLDTKGIDSVASNWHLNYLINNRNALLTIPQK